MPAEPGEPATGAAGRAAGPSARGQLVLAVVATTVGAVLLLWGLTRQWAVEVAGRPAPLHPLRTVHTGTDLVPWVPALALVALAGAGALVATRAAGRVLVSALLVVVGTGSVLGSGYGLLAARRLTDSASVAWPLVGVVGGVVVAATGWYALRRCRSWPIMGSRYETPTTTRPADPHPDDAEATTEPATLWDALDEGHDPTDR